ncbi:hypothetical protein QFZ27_000024 [Inquilinus ginsengisoli]|jgi:hypothetical protein
MSGAGMRKIRATATAQTVAAERGNDEMASRHVPARPKDGPAEDEIGECSSPPCYLHEIDPAYAGLDPKPKAKPKAEPSPKARKRDEAGS